MPFFRKKHERNLSTASSSKSSLFDFDGSTSSRANSELDLSETTSPVFPVDSFSYKEILCKSSYNDEIAQVLLKNKSRLSRTLDDLLHDHSALGYFIQYLESVQCGQLIKFWLDVESFKASTVSRLQSQNSNTATCNGSIDSSHDSHSSRQLSSNDISAKLGKSIQKDAVSIYSKYICQDASHPIPISHQMRSDIIAKICSENGEVDASCFEEAQKSIIAHLNTDYFPLFLNSVFHCKYQIDLLTSTKVYLADILYNDTALFYFMEFMELEGARNLIEFWLMIHNFQEQQEAARKDASFNAALAQDDAMVIYDKYFSLQAISPLGFTDQIRFEIEGNICSEDGPACNCFDKPVAMVLHLLETNYLVHFLRSQLFYKYLSELANTIQGGRLPYGRRRRSGSESSGSEHSAHSSSTNTLLAMDGLKPGNSSTTNPSRVLKNIDDQDMTIDTGKLNNPSNLWKRDLAGKLEMGKINKFGQFVSEFVPQPDAKESKLSKAVKKLVNREDSVKDEDMAWQVAQMIVKDVCSITMNDNGEDDKS